MSQRAPAYSIILAAGSGKRMNSPDLHKVCFPIGGKPAISRALDTYDACGVGNHILVVGDKAEQVMLAATAGAATADHRNVVFAYQRAQIGTADAARCGAAAIPATGMDEDVLIVAGDKVIEAGLLAQLFELYYGNNCDMAFVTGDRKYGPGLCRIVTDENSRVVGNVEAVDVAQRRTLREIRAEAEAGRALSASKLRAQMEAAVSPTKAPTAFASIWELVNNRSSEIDPQELMAHIPEGLTQFTFTCRDGEELTLSPDEVDRCDAVNQSIYLLKMGLLAYALDHLTSDNAQDEEYLSDIITVLARNRRPDGGRFTVRALHASDRHAVMAFNNPEELLEIEDHVRRAAERAGDRRPREGDGYRTIAEWCDGFATAIETGPGNGLYDHLVELYTNDRETISGRIGLYRRVLDHASTILNRDDRVLVVRSPGRVNLLGRHVDHQGGNCNLMTIGYETLVVVHPRDDDQVCLHSVDAEKFPTQSFAIGELVAALPWDDWLSVVNSETVLDMAREAQGNWSQYVVAAAVRLQKKYPDIKLTGADLIVAGDIPVAAGLSSSSSLVVGAAEALIEVNRLDTLPTQLVDLAGEGEWFVGTRGGSADHAAIKLGQKGKVVKVTFFDFAVEGTYDFPEEYVLAVCNSGITAQKSSGAKDLFNHRVACYRIGFQLIRQLFPQYAPLLGHLRDVNARNLHVPVSSIYKILLRLPEAATRDELRAVCGAGELERFFETHAEPEDRLYPVRGVVLYGLAECERSRRYGDLLGSGKINEIGTLMRVSHDGDRVAVRDRSGFMAPYESPTSNTHLLELIEDLESQEPERVVRAQLENQPGSYRCSIPEIDGMVDIAMETPGVAGAQLAGAGLGGCMMVLLHRDAADALSRGLAAGFYEPAGRNADILWCKPVAGSGALLRG